MNFSLVTYLRGEPYKQVRKLQEELGSVTESRACLDSWQPHLTVGDGIIVPPEKLTDVERALTEFAHAQQAFVVTTRGYGGTESWRGAVDGKVEPFVLWLDVALTDELRALFNLLRDRITSRYETWLPRMEHYVPHVTVAFSDLSEAGYRNGMKYLADHPCEVSVEVSHIALAECYGEGNMKSVEYKAFDFGR